MPLLGLSYSCQQSFMLSGVWEFIFLCLQQIKHLLRVIPVIGILWDRKAFNPTPSQSRISSLEMIVSYLKTNDPQFADFLVRQPPIIPPETDQPLDKALYQPLDRALHQPLHKALHQPLHKALHQPKDIPCCSSLSFVQPGN